MVADPCHRQIGDHLFIRTEPVEGVGVARGDDRVLVGEHHAFGTPGGARCIKNDADIAALAGGDFGFPLPQARGVIGELLAAEALHILERDQPGVVVVLEPARLVIDDAGKLRQPFGERDDLVDLLLILDDGELHLGMREHIGHFLGDGVGIDRHRHGAERLAGADRPIESRPIAADDGEMVAALEADLGHADREGANLLEHLLPGPGLPDAEILVADGGPAADGRGIVDQKLGEGVEAEIGLTARGQSLHFPGRAR